MKKTIEAKDIYIKVYKKCKYCKGKGEISEGISSPYPPNECFVCKGTGFEKIFISLSEIIGRLVLK